MSNTLIVILIILGAGILGGITNYFLIYEFSNDQLSEPLISEKRSVNFWKSVLVSLCSAITVPLFLQIISNNLLEAQANGNLPTKNYFILAGFCILAAFFSKRFLEDLYAKINKAEQKAENARSKIDQFEEEKKELDNVGGTLSSRRRITQESGQIPEADQEKVMKAILDSPYSYRTVKGISKQIGLPEDKVSSILNLLQKDGIAEKRMNKEKVEVWRILIK
jgi:hypothetical protein